jgi:hypothetical protein
MKIIINLGREIQLLGSVRESIMKPSETSSGKLYIINQGEEVHDYSQSAKIRARGVPRVLRREGYKGLLHRGLYTIFSTTR